MLQTQELISEMNVMNVMNAMNATLQLGTQQSWQQLEKPLAQQ
jgi:hypothetical protein